MKKVLGIVLVAIIIISLAGCSSEKKTTETATEKNTLAETAQEPSATPPVMTEQESSEKETEAETTEAETEAKIEKVTEATTEVSTEAPTKAPTKAPTEDSTETTTEVPTEAPTEAPAETPTEPATEPVKPEVNDQDESAIIAAAERERAEVIAYYEGLGYQISYPTQGYPGYGVTELKGANDYFYVGTEVIVDGSFGYFYEDGKKVMHNYWEVRYYLNQNWYDTVAVPGHLLDGVENAIRLSQGG